MSANQQQKNRSLAVPKFEIFALGILASSMLCVVGSCGLGCCIWVVVKVVGRGNRFLLLSPALSREGGVEQPTSTRRLASVSCGFALVRVQKSVEK
jgi:hypothetical protein